MIRLSEKVVTDKITEKNNRSSKSLFINFFFADYNETEKNMEVQVKLENEHMVAFVQMSGCWYKKHTHPSADSQAD